MVKYGWTSTLSTGDLACVDTSFDGDPDYGHDKQCFCETDPSQEAPPPVERCSENEGGECSCSGTVFYGRKSDPVDNAPLEFNDMKDYGYISITVDGSIQCSNGEFGDPAPGFAKQCFCEPEKEE